MGENSRLHAAIAVAVLCVGSAYSVAQTAPAATEASVSLVLTLKGHSNPETSGLSGDSLIVTAERNRAKVTDVLPLLGAQAGLELFIMMDNSQELSYGTQIEDIRHFILGQPPTTKIGVVYMDMQGPKIAQDLTADHALAAQAVAGPLGRLANGQSPYTSLSQLVDGWPPSDDRREVLMISNGEDATFARPGQETQNPYVDAAIEKAQRAGVIVFTIATSRDNVRLPMEEFSEKNVRLPVEPSDIAHAPGLGMFYLGKVAEATGGELYYYKSSAPVSFAPYLSDFTERLARQYRVSFLVKPAEKPALQSVKIRSELPHIATMTARKIYIPARP